MVCCLSECFQSAVTAVCTSSSEQKRAWKRNGSVSYKESEPWVPLMKHLAASDFPLKPVQLTVCTWRCAGHTTLTVHLFGSHGTYGWDQLGNPGTVTMVMLPLFFCFLLECSCCISIWYLWWGRFNNPSMFTCLSGTLLETNYDVKQVFWETFKYF